MTTPAERTRALVAAGDFLESLLLSDNAQLNEMSEERLRNCACTILRHYPSTGEIGRLADGEGHESRLSMPMLDGEAVPKDIRKGYRR
jgi:hypothetical protein